MMLSWISAVIAASFMYINDPVVNMREEPTANSRVASQTIFAEKITVLKQSNDWSLIKTPEGYEGWIPNSSYVTLEAPYAANLKVTRLAAHVYEKNDTEFGPFKTLPYESALQQLDDSDSRWIKVLMPNQQIGYIQKGDVAPETLPKNKQDLIEFSKRFLDLPYTWGGRSSFGYDCSGFVQMLYRQMGIMLPRDSKQQAIDPRFKTVPLEKLETGDLIFFGKSPEKITHVGIYLKDGYFIHTSVRENKPWLRISNLADFQWSGHKDAHTPYRLGRQLDVQR